MRRRYLVVEDHAVMFDVIRHGVLSIDPSAELTWVQTLAQASEFVRDNAASIDVLLLDNGLPDGYGVHWVSKARIALGPRPLIALCTSSPDRDLASATVAAGGDAYIQKSDASSIRYPLLELLRRERAA